MRRTRRLWLCLAGFLACLAIGAGVAGEAGAAGGAPTTAPFTECPAISHDTSCGLLINVVNGSAPVVSSDPNNGPYDGSDDTLVGVVNNSSATIATLTLSATSAIFGFDNDGICSATYGAWTGSSGCPYDSTGYAGPGVSFSGYTSNPDTGQVNFSPALAPGATAYFSLEEAVTTVSSSAPTNTAPPTITGGGSAQDGVPLTVNNGTWGGNPTFSYQWLTCNPSNVCSNATGSGATSPTGTYTPDDADVGNTLEVNVTASNGGGEETLVAGPTSAVLPAGPVNQSLPSIPPSPPVQQGVAVTASPGSWSGSPTSFDYQWLTCTAPNTCTDSTGTGATSSSGTYTPDGADVGNTLEVMVTAHNAGGHSSATSLASAAVEPPAPVNQSLPSIPASPAVQQGVAVTANPGTWSNSPTSFDYQWLTCTAPNACTDSTGSGATSSSGSYTPDGADVGNTLEVMVTAHNAGGQGSATSVASAAVEPPAPVNQTSPSIPGTPQQGVAVTATSGTWSNSPTSFDYQWLTCTAPNACTDSTGAGATSSSGTYTPDAADVGNTLEVMETAHNTGGSSSATSVPSAPVVPPPPTNQSPPSIPASPPVQQDVAVTANPGTWSNSPTSFTYIWLSCNGTCSDATGSGAATQIYTPDAADVGNTLEVQVTAHNAGGPGAATSAPSAAVLPPPPTNNSAPTITGASTAQSGVQLTATNGSWTQSPTSFTYQWSSCHSASASSCTAIATNAVSQTYTPTPADVGSFLIVTVTAHNSGGATPANSAETAAVLPPPPSNSITPQITGTAQPGQTLTVSNGTWTPLPSSFTYQWQQCDASGNGCTNIQTNAQSQTYMPTPGDVGHELVAIVTAKGTGGSTSTPSTPSEAVSVDPPSNSGLPSIACTPQQGQTLIAQNGSWNSSPDNFSYQWERCDPSGNGCSNEPLGGTSGNYVPTSGDVGDTLRVIVTAGNSSGKTPATSPPSGVILIAAPAISVLPQISGTAEQGQALSVSNGTWDNTPSGYGYGWWQCDASGSNCAAIQNQGTNAYTPVIGDVGHTLRASVEATNNGGHTTVLSGPTAVVAGLQASAPPPIFQQSADLAPVTGSVLIKLPGSNTFTPLTGPIDVPDGSVIDASQGTVSLTVQLPKGGGYETGQFYSGEFQVNQAHSGTLLATLAGGNFNVCTQNTTRGAHAAKSSSKKSKTVVRKLWGNAHGNYTTKGRYGSASVSGTIWLTEDTCAGTYFFALKDNIIVVSFKHPHKKHNIRQGHHFFIPAP